MKKKMLIILPLILLIVLAAGIYLSYNNAVAVYYNTASDLLKLLYSADNHQTLEKIENGIAPEGDYAIFEDIYKERYERLLTKEGYERLVANRLIFKAEEIVRDLGCTLELIDLDMTKAANTGEGNPIYAYKARIKVTFPSKENKELIEEGTLEFTKEAEQWKVSRLSSANYKILYKSIEELISGS